jgi:hypothetical protein
MAFAAAAWLALLHYADWMLVLPAFARTAGAAVTLLGLAAAVVILARAAGGGDDRRLAAELEAKFPELRQELSTAVQYALGDKSEGCSEQLVAELVRTSRERLARLDPARAYPTDKLPFGRAAAWALLALISIALLKPGELIISCRRYLIPGAVIGDWRGAEISPGDARVAPGGNLTVAAVVAGPGAVEVSSGRGVARHPMRREAGKLTVQMADIRQDFSYRILNGRLQSPSFMVRCHDQLLLSDLRVSVRPPAYSGLPERLLEGQGDYAALKGSRISLTARTSQPLAEGGLWLEPGAGQPALVSDSGLAVELTLTASRQYRLWGRSLSGDTLAGATAGRMHCLADRPPEVEFLGPESGPDSDARVRLEVRAGDDFGLSEVRLCYLAAGAEHRQGMLKPVGRLNDTAFSYLWELGGLELMPGDSVVCWLEALDNDRVSGPKLGRSRVRVIRLQGFEEILRSLVQADSVAARELGRAEDSRRQLQEEVERLAESLKESRRTDWQQQAAVENLLSRQQELAERLEQAVEESRRSLDGRESRWNFDPETMEKLARLRDLLDQVATDRMRQDMERLRQALEGMDRREVARAMENLKISQEDFQRQLDRTLALLKELQLEQAVETLERRMEQLADDQRELKNRTDLRELPGQDQRLAEQQRQLARQLEQLKAGIRETAGQLGENDRQAAAQMDQAARGLEGRKTGPKMEQAAGRLEEGGRQQASLLQQQVMGDLEQASAGLRGARNSMRQARSRAAAQAARRRAGDLLDLSRQQESLNRAGAGRSGIQSDLAHRQQILQRQAGRVARELDDLARQNLLESPRARQSMQEALRQMGQSAQGYSEGSNGQAGQSGRQALSAVNGAAMALMESTPGSSSGGSGDMMQDLSGLSGQQQAVNQGTGSMLPLEGGMSQQARSQMARLAAQQEAVRQGMEDFNRRYGDRRDLTGRLDDLVDEMRRVAEELKNNRVSRQTIERQERILTRMLDAQHSLKEREFSRERQAERGRLPEGNVSPEGQGPGGGNGQNPWRNWRQEHYPLEYHDALEEYFRSLGQ